MVHVLATKIDYFWLNRMVLKLPTALPMNTTGTLQEPAKPDQFCWRVPNGHSFSRGLSVLDNSTRIHGKLHPMMAIISIGSGRCRCCRGEMVSWLHCQLDLFIVVLFWEVIFRWWFGCVAISWLVGC